MISNRCHKCLWFDREHISLREVVNGKNAVPENFGYCRKHKPMVFSDKGRYYGGWPLVDINDFCGEFRKDEQ